MLTIALSKGRILEQTLPLLEKAGLSISEKELQSRKLVLDTNLDEIKVIIIRASDVPVFVQHGAADLGIAGKDVLLEHGANGVFELIDLGISKCKLMVASKPDQDLNEGTLKVATKYVKSTKAYFHSQGRQVEIIKLSGAMELAPIVGLADIIVDLVSSGKTLEANNLIPVEQVSNITSRLIVNKASLKLNNNLLKPMIKNFTEAVN